MRISILILGFKGLMRFRYIEVLFHKFYYSGFVPFFEPKIQGLFKHLQGHISHFSRTPFCAKKSLVSMSFLALPQHEQFYPEGLLH